MRLPCCATLCTRLRSCCCVCCCCICPASCAAPPGLSARFRSLSSPPPNKNRPTRRWSRSGPGCAARPPRSPGCCALSTLRQRPGSSAAARRRPRRLRRRRRQVRSAGSRGHLRRCRCCCRSAEPRRRAATGSNHLALAPFVPAAAAGEENEDPLQQRLREIEQQFAAARAPLVHCKDPSLTPVEVLPGRTNGRRGGAAFGRLCAPAVLCRARGLCRHRHEAALAPARLPRLACHHASHQCTPSAPPLLPRLPLLPACSLP